MAPDRERGALVVCRGEGGFILPLSVLLVIVLAISGAGFLQHDYLERRMTMNEVDNLGAFYLANAGIERTREALAVPKDFIWTAVLDDTHPDHPADHPTDPAPAASCLDPLVPDSCLCPDPSRGCVIPPFQTQAANPGIIDVDGDPVTAPDFPVAGIFDGSPEGTVFYSARAFNNEPGKTDTDKRLIIRALGVVRGEETLLEVTAEAATGVKLINCQGDVGDPCPDVAKGNPPKYLDPAEGHDPASHPELPSLPPLIDPVNPAACNPANFYCDPTHFNDPSLAPYVTNVVTLGPGLTLSAQPTSGTNVKIQDNTFYLITGDVLVKDTTVNHDVVIYSLGNAELQSPYVVITDAIVIGATGVRLNGNLKINEPLAPLPYPTIISGGNVTQGSSSIEVFGNIFAVGSVLLNPIDVHGVVIGSYVETQGGAGTLFTDDGNLAYYEFMEGFSYPTALRVAVGVTGEWREIQ